MSMSQASRIHHTRRPQARNWCRTQLLLEKLEARELLSSGTGLGPLVQVSSSTPFTNFGDIAGQSGTIYLNSEVEPRIAVDPTNPLHLVGVYQQDRWSNGGCRGIMAADSVDGGNTWTLTPVTGMTINEGGNTLRASDPWVSFSPNGVVYASGLVFNDPNVQTPQGVDVSKSTDGGLTWQPAIELLHTNDNSLFSDKDSLTADPTNSNFIYAVWDQLNFNNNTGPTLFSRSTDGGQTWSTPVSIYDPGVGAQTLSNQIVVMPNGTLVNMFVHFYSSGAEEVDVIRSTDHGATWSGPLVVSPLQQVFERDPDNGAGVRAGDIPDIGVNRKNGNLYVTFQTGTFSGFTHDDIALTYSTNGGQTWTTPFKFNKTPTNIPTVDQQAFTPSIAVANNGTVAVTYYDFRKNTTAPGALTDTWIVTANPTNLAAHKPGRERRLTTSSFDIEQAPNANGYFLGDYEGLTAMGTNYNSFGAFFAIANNSSDPTSIYFRDPSSSGRAASPGLAKVLPGQNDGPAESTLASSALAVVHNLDRAGSSDDFALATFMTQQSRSNLDDFLASSDWLWELSLSS
jgi:hypothetical protein